MRVRRRGDVHHNIFRDFLFTVVLFLTAMFGLTLLLVNPPDPASKQAADPPGNVIAHVTWTKGDYDVDLWVTGPGEPRPVGYSNPRGVLWDLLRDDLGASPDVTDLNYENAFTRGIVPGEYVVNVHCYRCADKEVEVQVEASVKPGDAKAKAGLVVIAGARLKLRQGQERTAMRFRLTADGQLVPGSLNNVFKPLRAEKDN